MKRFTPPGFVNDFDEGQDPEKLRQAWHDYVQRVVDSRVNAKYASGNPRFPRFYNPLEQQASTSTQVTIVWDGFPRKISAWMNLDPISDPEDWEHAFRSAEPLEEWVMCYLAQYRQISRVSPSRLPQGVANAFVDSINQTVDLSTLFTLKARLHDEYLEWHTHRDPDTNRVTKLSFTAEPPEYWEIIGNNDPALLETLYKRYISDDVTLEELLWPEDVALPVIDLITDPATGQRRLGHAGWTTARNFRKGQYNQFNKWNTTHGAMHLIQRANTLGAEINLAADATLAYQVRADIHANPEQSKDRFKLAACAQYGGINRNSDPRIGWDINTAVEAGNALSISDPMGLYIGAVQLEGLRDPQGNVLQKSDVYHPVRGDDDEQTPRILRFEITPPDGAEYGLEECTLGDYKLANGGPVAQATSINIHGEIVPSSAANPAYRCDGKLCIHPTKPEFFSQPSINGDCESDENNWSAPFAEIPRLMNFDDTAMMAETHVPPRDRVRADD